MPSITSILVDLDGTVGWICSEKHYDPDTIKWLKFWTDLPNRKACVFSNVIAPWLVPRAQRYASSINAECHACLAWTAKKPEIKATTLALAAIGASPENTIWIGDMLHRDTLGANIAGIPSAYVPTLGPYPWWKPDGIATEKERRQELGIQFPPPGQIFLKNGTVINVMR